MYLDIGWTCGGVAHSHNNLCYWSQAQTMEQLSTWHQALFMGSESHFTAVQKECATPPHVHPTSRCMSLHVISFTMPSSALVLQAANAGARRPGYQARSNVFTNQWYHFLAWSPIRIIEGGLVCLCNHFRWVTQYRDEGTFGIKPLHKLDPVELECKVIAFVE